MCGCILFFIVFLVNSFWLYKKDGMSPSVFLYFLYSASAFCSIILLACYDNGQNPLINDYNSGVIYLTIALLLFLYPFKVIDYSKIKALTIPADNIYRPMVIICTLLSYFSIIYFTRICVSVFQTDITNVATYRHLVAIGENPFIANSIFNTIAGTSASFYVLQLLFFFVSLLNNEKIKKTSIILLLSSLSYPLYVLAYLGRDGIVFWLFSFISLYLMFRKYLSDTVLNKLKTILIIISVPLLLLFVWITVGRFVYGEGFNNILYPIVNYMGQPPINFAEFFYTGIRNMGFGANMFPLIFHEQNDISIQLEQYNIVTWVFKTFVSSMYSDFGPILTLCIAAVLIIAFYISYKNIKYSKCFSFSFLILFNLFFTIYSQGVFYFRQYNRVGNLFIIIMLLLAFVLTFLPKRTIILKKT